MATINPVGILTQDTYNDKGFSTITELSRAYQSEAPWLAPAVTHLSYAMGGDYTSNNFPMLYATEGQGYIETVPAFEYKYPILGKMKNTSAIAKTTYLATDKPGLGNQVFRVFFTDRWFSDKQVLYTPSRYSVLVQGDPERVGDSWMYTVQMWGGNPSSYLPVGDLTVGKLWAGGPHKVAFENSKGVENRSYLGGTATNMTSLVRNTLNMRGNVENKVMKYQIKVDGKTYTTYTEWEQFLAEMQFRERCEADLWWSEYGKNSQGEMYMIDNGTSVPITSGAGIDQQITNIDTYSTLTYSKISNLIRDVFFNIAGAKPRIEMWTGTAGAEQFDLAMKQNLQGFTQFIDSKTFVEGSNDWDLVYGAYFTAFRHVDGGTVKIYKHPMFDKGPQADIADVDPTTGLPVTSGDFYFLDTSVYDGKRNIRFVQEKGRELKKWVVAGSFVPKGFPDSPLRATDRDASSVEMMRSQGIQIMNPSCCFKLKQTIN